MHIVWRLHNIIEISNLLFVECQGMSCNAFAGFLFMWTRYTCMQLWQFSISDLVPPCGSLWEAIAWSYFLSNSSVCWRVVSQAQHMSYVLKHTRVGVRLIWSDFHSKLLVTIFDSTSLLRKVVTVNVCSCLYICSYGYKLHPRHLGSKVAKDIDFAVWT